MSDDAPDETYGLNVGTYEDGLQWVGRSGAVRFAELAVNQAMVRNFVSAIEDPNELYWDDATASRVCGAPVAPPAMMTTWVTPRAWAPGASDGSGTAMLVAVPLPGDSMINMSSEFEFFDHVRIGDRLNVVETVEAVSEEKTTRVGKGHFLTVVSTFRRETGEMVASQRNVIFRFWSAGAQ